VLLSHKELLGTWQENAALFSPGETVQGIVRGVEDYGVFVELLPNLSGLCEKTDGLREGERVVVYIKSILPERMKIKLNLIDRLPAEDPPPRPRYFLPEGRLDVWRYSPPGCRAKQIETVFG
jgi:small subunit ribosomal protein S1